MSQELSIFRSAEGHAQYLAAYEAMFALWPVPHESVSVQTRFGTTHINASGPKDAPPVVLLHAGGLSSTAWFANIGALSRSHRAYAIDIIGDAGKSKISKRLQNIGDYASWLSDVFDGLAIDRASLIGHSLGGWMAISMAMTFSIRLNRLILLAPAASIHSFGWLTKLNLTLAPFMIRPPARSTLRFAAAKGAILEQRFIDLMDLMNKYCRPEVMTPTVYSDEELATIATPTLLLIGDQERIYKPAAAIRRATQLIRDIRTEIVPNAGHLLTMEQPDFVNGRILAFIE